MSKSFSQRNKIKKRGRWTSASGEIFEREVYPDGETKLISTGQFEHGLENILPEPEITETLFWSK